VFWMVSRSWTSRGNQRTGDGDAPGRPWRPGDPHRTAGRRPLAQLVRLPGVEPWQAVRRLDLKVAKDKERLVALASKADVLIRELLAWQDRRNWVSTTTRECGQSPPGVLLITGYGSDGSDADRPGIDALVAARMGQQWRCAGFLEARSAGWRYRRHVARTGGSTRLLGGTRPDGPLFTGVPWVSMATFYIASLGINAAIRVRETTGGASTSTPRSFMAFSPLPSAPGSRSKIPTYPTSRHGSLTHGHPRASSKGLTGAGWHHWVPARVHPERG